MADPKMPGFDEKREKLVRFVVMPGRLMSRNEDEPGKPVAWFVRVEGSESTLSEDRPNEPFLDMLAELYGEENMDYHVGYGPSRTSDRLRETAQAYADLLNSPEIQQKVRSIIDQRRKLAEAIKQAEAKIQAEIARLAATLNCTVPKPREWEVVSD